MTGHAFQQYQNLLRAVYLNGERSSPRGQATIEREDFVFKSWDPSDVLLSGFRPKFSNALAALEALQLIGGFSDPDLTVHVAPMYRNFADDGAFWGAYGLRTGSTMALTLDRLQQDRSTRQAVVQFWKDQRDLGFTGKRDYPCTMHANFRIRNNALNATFVMRSNDVWLGFPYDIFQFSALQRTVADFLQYPAGTYTHIAHSMHLYERDIDNVRYVLKLDAHREQEQVGNQTLGGGIVVPTEQPPTWTNVQRRAKQICYEPEAVDPLSETEEWLVARAKTWTDRLDEREQEPDASGFERCITL